METDYSGLKGKTSFLTSPNFLLFYFALAYCQYKYRQSRVATVPPDTVMYCVNSLQSCPTLCNTMNCSYTRLLCPWDSPGKNTGVGCLFLLQGTLSTQGLNLPLLYLPLWQLGSLPLAPTRKPILYTIFSSSKIL